MAKKYKYSFTAVLSLCLAASAFTLYRAGTAADSYGINCDNYVWFPFLLSLAMLAAFSLFCRKEPPDSKVFTRIIFVSLAVTVVCSAIILIHSNTVLNEEISQAKMTLAARRGLTM